MFVIRAAIVMLMVSGGIAQGTVTSISEKRKVLVEGVTKALVAKFGSERRWQVLGKLIFQQKQAYALHMDEKYVERQLRWHADDLRQDVSEYEELMNREVKGELIPDEQKELLFEELNAMLVGSIISRTGQVYEPAHEDISDPDKLGHYVQHVWFSASSRLDEVERLVAEDKNTRRPAIADYFATLQRDRVISVLKTVQWRNSLAEETIDMQVAIKEGYLETLHIEELENLAKALGEDELLLAAETVNSKMLREAKTEKISKLSTVLARIAAQKEAEE